MDATQLRAMKPASRFTPAAPAPVSSSNVPTKPAEEDKIGPVGTAYTPIKLQPKKLVNPFAAMETRTQADAPASRGSPAGGASFGTRAQILDWTRC